ncbi:MULTISPECIES: hypothetical protein [Sorangium]|uniref:Uncharacterized protein n=1 Tax=Sorangium cellulosum TaxID=56 RepID=A0A4P2R5N3_SORCE|nr:MULTISPECIES: hypothetical protein [Sorangium]AUX38444.1 hypothetical protein SOCE836_106880 [Sorangium cellulosum]WCQ97733.1 hypothetical protein NQZ70_10530 [Sorangium sp. Soce836]
MIVDPRDVRPGEGPEKVAWALARFSVDEARDEAAFDEGYRALDEVFGPKGELERREVLAAWFAGRHTDPAAPIEARYHMLLARSVDDGRLAGVRDGYVTLDRAARRCVMLLSHALVLPAYRRTGLAALLRAAPVALARRALEGAGLGGGGAEVMLAAEMEAVDPDDRDSVVRLIAYGRAGFAIVPPAVLPYAQPDFRDVAALGVAPVPLPLLAVVRQVGEEGRDDIPRARAASFLRHYQAVHAAEVSQGELAPIRENALARLAAFPGERVPLIRIPRGPAEIAGFAPVLRSAVMPLFPPAWRGKAPLDAPDRELERLVAAWAGGGER